MCRPRYSPIYPHIIRIPRVYSVYCKALEEARLSGSTEYFTGRGCKHGHIANRYTSNRQCVICLKNKVKEKVDLGYYKEFWLKNKHRITTKRKIYREKNADKIKKDKHSYYLRNSEKIKARVKEWAGNNRELTKLYRKKANQNNPGRGRAKQSLRRNSIKNATPQGGDWNELVTFYGRTPLGHHVDHIIPLRSPVVCGLHTLRNLRYLPANVNKKKYNYFNSEEWIYDKKNLQFIRVISPDAPDYDSSDLSYTDNEGAKICS